MFSILLIELENSIVEGFFSAKKFTDRYNDAISGTVLHSLDKPKRDEEILPYEKRQKMMQRTKRDLSLASFFHAEGLIDLPEDARNILLDMGIIPNIQSYFLIPYKKTHDAVAKVSREDYSPLQLGTQKP